MKLTRALILVSAATIVFARPAAAQTDGLAEIVVTAQKREYDPAETPFVVMKKRADNLIVTVRVVCDTRDLSQRRDELKATLRNLVRAAKEDKTIELSVGEEVLGGFDESMLDKVIKPEGRPDTSRADLVIKTRVAADDTFDAATGRITKFIKQTPKVGRTEVLLEGEWQLTLIGPGQYRPEVAKLIAEDARRMASVFGEGYGVKVTGLQLPVSWYQAGPLDLALYIPYKLEIAPIGK